MIIIDIFRVVSLSLSPREGTERFLGNWSRSNCSSSEFTSLACHVIASSEDKWTYVCSRPLAGVYMTSAESEFTLEYSRN